MAEAKDKSASAPKTKIREAPKAAEKDDAPKKAKKDDVPDEEAVKNEEFAKFLENR